MSRYIIRKVLLAIPMLLAMMIFLFLVLQLTPGDPAQVALGESATPENVAKLRQMWQLDDPLYIQIPRFVVNTLRGDLGLSYLTKRPVGAELVQTFPATLQLAASAIVIAAALGIPLGILAATKRGSALDSGIMAISLFGLSVPVFVIGLVAILIFGYRLGWFPVAGRTSPTSLILPAVTLALPTAAELARMTRSAMLEQLTQDYLRTARAKGLTGRMVVLGHALRNALIPVVTLLGLRMGALLAGTVVIETVFSWPGLGRLLLDAILARDYPLIRGGVLLIAVVFLAINLLVDLLYAVLDPRIRYG
jgi:ABC-type dipeptide/oligopeptide/nickel transport system permease component